MPFFLRFCNQIAHWPCELCPALLVLRERSREGGGASSLRLLLFPHPISPYITSRVKTRQQFLHRFLNVQFVIYAFSCRFFHFGCFDYLPPFPCYRSFAQTTSSHCFPSLSLSVVLLLCSMQFVTDGVSFQMADVDSTPSVDTTSSPFNLSAYKESALLLLAFLAPVSTFESAINHIHYPYLHCSRQRSQ